MTTKKIDREAVLLVGGQILAAHLAVERESTTIHPARLDALADLSVRAAVALDAAIPRAEERLAAEVKAAEEAEAAQAAADKATAAAEKQQTKDDTAEAKAAAKK